MEDYEIDEVPLEATPSPIIPHEINENRLVSDKRHIKVQDKEYFTIIVNNKYWFR